MKNLAKLAAIGFGATAAVYMMCLGVVVGGYVGVMADDDERERLRDTEFKLGEAVHRCVWGTRR